MDAAGAAVAQVHAGVGGSVQSVLVEADRQGDAAHADPVQRQELPTGLGGDIGECQGGHVANHRVGVRDTLHYNNSIASTFSAPSLATCQAAAAQAEALAAGTGDAVERGPAHPAAVADPDFAIAGQACVEDQLTVAAAGLRPATLARYVVAAQIDDRPLGLHAVVAALLVRAGQQVGAARAVGEIHARYCRLGAADGAEQGYPQQCLQ
ncbi:hypothetical protein L1887_51788 [Cichorium endivia]|nr:hypothetical protein L1887_51788 [Cichorium endivia]